MMLVHELAKLLNKLAGQYQVRVNNKQGKHLFGSQKSIKFNFKIKIKKTKKSFNKYTTNKLIALKNNISSHFLNLLFEKQSN
jgi:hypothetical protein